MTQLSTTGGLGVSGGTGSGVGNSGVGDGRGGLGTGFGASTPQLPAVNRVKHTIELRKDFFMRSWVGTSE